MMTVLAMFGVTAPAARGRVAASTLAPVVIVLDASGSMNTPDAPGPRIAAAKRAVIGLVRTLPAQARVAMLTYGTRTGSSPAAKAAGCRDIRLLAGLGRLQKARLIRAVRGVRARGYTPIGAALRRAAGTLPKGPGSIVLVSDGQDTCAPPDPCAVARQLKHADRDLIVHTIGFRVDRAARRQLNCISAATGGTYRDAANGAGLGPVLRTQVDAGMRPYVVTGKPIDGTPTPTDAPLIAPGQYADAFAASGGPVTKYYSIQLTAPETFYVGATAVPPALRGGGTRDRLEVAAELRDADGDRCLSSEREHDSVLAGKVDPVTVLLSGVVGGADWSKRCPHSGPFVVALTRSSPSTTVTQTEIVVRLEPPVRAVPPAVTNVPPGLPAPRVDRSSHRSCIGGASFDTAPSLGAGTCRDTLATGETRYYRVHLATGQRLAYTVLVGRVAGAGHGVGEVQSAVATPMRGSLTLASTSNAARDFGGPVSITLTGSTLVPVDYGNRNSERSDIRPYSLAGDYYLSLGMSYPIDALPYRTDVAISVHVVGKALPGPAYLPMPGADVSTSPSSPTVATTSATPSTSATSTTSGDSASGTSGSRPWLIGGIVALALVVVGGTVLRRRSSGQRR
jgi:Ca-activated chloride channel homolog